MEANTDDAVDEQCRIIDITTRTKCTFTSHERPNTDTLAVQYKLRGSTTPSVEVMRFTCSDNSSFNVDSNGTMASGIIKQLPEYTGAKLLEAATAAEPHTQLNVRP
eukprot:11849-Prymnesium_polylepis.1